MFRHTEDCVSQPRFNARLPLLYSVGPKISQKKASSVKSYDAVSSGPLLPVVSSLRGGDMTRLQTHASGDNAVSVLGDPVQGTFLKRNEPVSSSP